MSFNFFIFNARGFHQRAFAYEMKRDEGSGDLLRRVEVEDGGQMKADTVRLFRMTFLVQLPPRTPHFANRSFAS